MSSEIEICNLALSHLGNAANVSSIDPPEGSVEAFYCAQFYPLARDAMLESHNWKFNTRRGALELLVDTNDQWLYVYAKPNLTLKIIAVIPPDATNDNNISSSEIEDENFYTGKYAPQAYCIETLSSGSEVICTNQEDAAVRYTVYITDTAKFTPLFKMALSYMVAAMIAGPLLKGKTGREESKRCLSLADEFIRRAKGSDSSQYRSNVVQQVPWLTGR